jgi:hypothetical protein
MNIDRDLGSNIKFLTVATLVGATLILGHWPDLLSKLVPPGFERHNSDPAASQLTSTYRGRLAAISPNFTLEASDDPAAGVPSHWSRAEINH